MISHTGTVFGPRLPGLGFAPAEAAVRHGVEVAAATCALPRRPALGIGPRRPGRPCAAEPNLVSTGPRRPATMPS
ncbi:hypothetical protein ACZ90_30245 [Streptomyces albus subsp. albus]|nr:hypothetical protein ACZ90_30245 [Streptomyces albus subsp. albus]